MGAVSLYTLEERERQDEDEKEEERRRKGIRRWGHGQQDACWFDQAPPCFSHSDRSLI